VSAVLDASVFIAAVSPLEVHHAQAQALYGTQPDHTPFVVPAIFPLEVISGLARRGEPEALIDHIDALIHGPRFHAVAVDAELLDVANQVTRLARLRAYDALYVAVALDHDGPLLTLDQDLIRRVRAVLPQVHFPATA